MKTPAFLFVLICSVSVDAAPSDGSLDNHILEEAVSLTRLEYQLKCLTEKFEGQSVKLKELETLLEEQSAKLKEQETQLGEQEAVINGLKEKDEEQSAKLKDQETQLGEQSAKLKEQETQLGEQQAVINKMEKNASDSQVAFSASLTETETVTLGPYNTHTPLIFKHAITNVGNAYNPETGVFTAPVRGVYHFELHLYGPGGDRMGGWLMKNGQRISMAYVHEAGNQYPKASTGASLVLEVGDQVSVTQYEKTQVYDNGNHHLTFSGHLVFLL